jgi:NTP pyrophosphatase (non-canonical NTP hydrolase)
MIQENNKKYTLVINQKNQEDEHHTFDNLEDMILYLREIVEEVGQTIELKK